MESLPSTNALYGFKPSAMPDPVVTTAENSTGVMSLNENGTSSGLDSKLRLRQPMAKNTELNEFNGSSSPWPSKNNTLPGDRSIWNQSLFDFSPLPSATVVDNNGWQNLNGLSLTDLPWRENLSASNGKKQPPGFENAHCSSCKEIEAKAIAHCQDCKEELCQVCYNAHLRVTITKSHVIQWLVKNPPVKTSLDSVPDFPEPPASQPKTPSTMPGLPENSRQVGSIGTGDFLANRSEVLQVYQGAVEKAKSESKALINQASVGMNQIDEAQGHIKEMKARIELRYNTVKAELTSISQNYIVEIQKRQEFLMKRLDLIRARKMNVLDKQIQDLMTAHKSLKATTEQLSFPGHHEMELIKATNQANETLKDIQTKCGNLLVHEDDGLEFTYPDPNVLKSLSSFSFIGGSGFASSSVAEGDGLKKAILGKDARFIVVLKDQLGEQRLTGGDPLRVNVIGPDGRIVRHSVFDGQNGTYRVIWKPSVVGEHFINVTLKDLHIQSSPFRVKVRMGRNYASINEPLKFFGTEGETEGQLCRPWGVCCSKSGLILVANRSNNRIEVFDKEGRFAYKFGTSGKGQGEFERPASVAVDNMNRVIVTDKDNHRIQIFTLKGEYLQMFGEKGSKPGQFNYPWDVATNSRDQILVSDTRNHRIQLFSPHGDFLLKYGFEGRDWKHFDSPRGVCFMPDDQIVVTDFNNHRLLVVNQELSCAQYLGKEGSDEGMFTRPNGVAVDEEGNIIVADSRNDRIQVFTSSGRFISKFGTKGTLPGEFDRPSGICISPEGAIIVVDFGNNRVQIF